ncbi:dimethylsulfonioproprionate lyase family protein [Pacificoceanicola onchidii]|uniref:dimethylsulfonioproprionate lyase family protein n=1 Tax=Pacificoceanicola onchidii TaxID=2562685 RepID=UPI0010A631AB|nr:dimethylsulfonioproprionate lyase family protein [Pacificoceanicola onchidii]
MSLAALLNAVRALHESTPALQDFAPFPKGLRAANLPPMPCRAASLLAQNPLPGNRQTQPVTAALCAAAGQAEWRQTYSEAEVGAAFLANYGYLELYGPSGHFHTNTARGYIGYWGPGLRYDWHLHEAEELYACLSGAAEFQARGVPDKTISTGGTAEHACNQPHAMTTTDQPFLAYVVWRGAGLAGLPQMEVA